MEREKAKNQERRKTVEASFSQLHSKSDVFVELREVVSVEPKEKRAERWKRTGEGEHWRSGWSWVRLVRNYGWTYAFKAMNGLLGSTT